MSSSINIRVIKKQTASERLRAIFATRYGQFNRTQTIVQIEKIFLKKLQNMKFNELNYNFTL